MKENIHQKLIELLFARESQGRDYHIRDIFGHQQGTAYVKGLVDAERPADFDLRLSKLESKWDGLEVSVYPQRVPVNP